MTDIGTEPANWNDAFASLARTRGTGLLVMESSSFSFHRAKIAELTLRHRLPAIYGLKAHTKAGGLVSYGTDLEALYRRGGAIVTKVLRGVRPADIPVEQPAIPFRHQSEYRPRPQPHDPTVVLLRAVQVIE